MTSNPSPIITHPLTPDRWPDLVDLFGPERGASSGCWCMWPRLARADWKALGRQGRKDAFQALVETGPAPGLLAYEGATTVGWVAVGPRERAGRFDAAKLSRSPQAPARTAGSLYAITCFFVRAGHRRRGLTRTLALAAIDFARASGAAAVDVCAIEADRPLIWGDGFVGVASVFRALGFAEIARRSPRRPLMRLEFSGHG